MVRYQLAKRRAGTHKTQTRDERLAHAPRSSTSRRAPAARVTARATRRSSSAAAWPTVRIRATTRTTCPRRSARWRCGTRSRPRRRTATRRPRRAVGREDQGRLRASSRSSASRTPLFIAGAKSTRSSPRPPATSRNIDVLPNAGLNVYDILRRKTLVLTARRRRGRQRAASPKRREGVTPMAAARRAAPRRAALDTSPGDHREGDAALRAEQGRLPRAARRHQDEIKEAVEALFNVNVVEVNTIVRQGQDQDASAASRASAPTSRKRS